MSFESLLIDTCTVRRFTTGAADDYGKLAETWTDHITNEPCRLTPVTNKEIVVGAEVVRADYDLFIGNVDVTEQDRILIGLTTYEILSVMLRKSFSSHHKELLMRTVR